MLKFKEFLLEYNEDKNWEIHGPKITERLKSQGIEDNHKEFWNKQIQDHDPTRNKEYGQWISRTYANGGINHHEDIGSRVGPALEKYHKAKISKKLASHGVSADINTHKTLGHLEDSVEKLPKEETDSKKISNDEATKHDEKHWTVITPHTEAASQKYGKGTRWCTAADRNCMFSQYHKEGPLHIYIPKNPKHPGEKYQVHTNTLSFMNEKDEPIDDRDVFKDRPSPHYEKHGINEKHITKALNSKDRWVREMAISHPRIKPEHITKALDDDNFWVRYLAINNSKATPEHIEKAIKDKQLQVQAAAAQHPNATHEQINRFLDHPHDAVREAAVHNPNLTPEHIQKALKDSSGTVRVKAIKNPNASIENLHAALNSDQPETVREYAAMHKNINKDHIKKALSDRSSFVRLSIIKNRKTPQKDIENATKDSHYYVRYTAYNSLKNVEPKHLEAALNDPDIEIQKWAATHKKLPSDMIHKVIKTSNPDIVRELFHNNRNIKEEHIDTALNHHVHSIRAAGIAHPSATPKQISKALDDEHIGVRNAAAYNPQISSNGLFKALADKNMSVVQTALKNKNISPDHLTRALKHPHIQVREDALEHQLIDSNHINRALNDSSPLIRRLSLLLPSRHSITEKHVTKALKDPEKEVRFAALGPKTSGVVTAAHINKALDDESPRIRYRALEHPAAHLGHIEKALKDPEPIIRERAQELFNNRKKL